MKRKLISVTAFIVILALFGAFAASVLSFKYGDGNLNLTYFYKLPEDSLDVLVLGSSHAFEDVNTQILYDEYGYTSYDMAGSIQPFWNSYYYLVEALRTQTPKIVLLEGYAASRDFTYSDHSRIIKNSLGIKDPITRIESICVSSAPDSRDDYIFDYRLWHSRYEEINNRDFPEYYDNPRFRYYTGFGMNFANKSYDIPPVDTYVGLQQINHKEEVYFRRIIGLCQQNNIPVLVFVSPYILNEKDQRNFNHLQSICEELQVDYINYNSTQGYSEIGLDFQMDFADGQHLNNMGNEKFTRVLGKKISEIVGEQPDRQGDGESDYWVQNSRYFKEQSWNHQLSSTDTVERFLSCLSQGTQCAIFLYTVNETNRIAENAELFAELGIPSNVLADGRLYRLDGEKVTVLSEDRLEWNYDEERYGRSLVCRHGINVDGHKASTVRNLIYDGREYLEKAQGTVILVFNDYTKELVCAKSFQMDGNNVLQVISL